jgi:choline dehydrogenase-like flavoprotein
MLKKIVETGGGSIINSEIISPKKQSTVHIFGTLPITSSIFIQGTNKLKKDPRIRISDGSIIPYGPGVNPQGVIMTAVKIANRNLTS